MRMLYLDGISELVVHGRALARIASKRRLDAETVGEQSAGRFLAARAQNTGQRKVLPVGDALRQRTVPTLKGTREAIGAVV